jgi:hypothetical protein
MWVESLRLLPGLPRERRIAFCNGLSVGYQGTAVIFGFAGFHLAAGLPPLFAGALLFLTPMSFLISTARNARQMVDRLALALGLIIGPLLTFWHVGLDLMWTGVVGGSLAHGIHRLREVARYVSLCGPICCWCWWDFCRTRSGACSAWCWRAGSMRIPRSWCGRARWRPRSSPASSPS